MKEENSQSDLATHLFEGHRVRVVGTKDNPEFIAVDTGNILGIQNISDTLAYFDEDETGIATIYTSGQARQMLTVTEAGLYRLIFKSRKPIAKRFQRWIFHEVLPSIRKTGSYSLNQVTDESADPYIISDLMDDVKQLKEDTQALRNIEGQKELPGLRSMVREYSRPMQPIPVGLVEPFTFTDWCVVHNVERLAGYLPVARRVAEIVKVMRNVGELPKKSQRNIYYYSDLPAIKAAIRYLRENIYK